MRIFISIFNKPLGTPGRASNHIIHESFVKISPLCQILFIVHQHCYQFLSPGILFVSKSTTQMFYIVII